MKSLEATLSEQSIIDCFLAGRNPGYSVVEKWIETVVFFHGWGNRIDPADVRQETLSAVLNNLRNGKYAGSGLKGYVQSICKNMCLMALRRSYRSDHQSLEGIEIIDPAGNPESLLLQEERYSQFKRVFSKLSSLCKRMLVMRFVKNQSYREIGNRFDLSEGTARVRLFRCLERAKELAIETNEM